MQIMRNFPTGSTSRCSEFQHRSIWQTVQLLQCTCSACSRAGVIILCWYAGFAQKCVSEVLWRRCEQEAEAAGEAERGQKTDEESRVC